MKFGNDFDIGDEVYYYGNCYFLRRAIVKDIRGAVVTLDVGKFGIRKVPSWKVSISKSGLDSFKEDRNSLLVAYVFMLIPMLIFGSFIVSQWWRNIGHAMFVVGFMILGIFGLIAYVKDDSLDKSKWDGLDKDGYQK